MTDETKKLIEDLVRLGCTFDRGSAYISVAYIKAQEELKLRAKDLIEKLSQA